MLLHVTSDHSGIRKKKELDDHHDQDKDDEIFHHTLSYLSSFSERHR
jgi:hypothetical protein